jgi:hypothetical protein
MARMHPSFHNTRAVPIPRRPALPAYPICNKEVQLETAKTDEVGRALHEECYLLRLNLRRSTTPTEGVS